MYRYRGKDGGTREGLRAFRKHHHKIGEPTEVRGYTVIAWCGFLGVSPYVRVTVRGKNGTLRLGGFQWGYSGEGPRGLEEILYCLGIPCPHWVKYGESPLPKRKTHRSLTEHFKLVVKL